MHTEDHDDPTPPWDTDDAPPIEEKQSLFEKLKALDRACGRDANQNDRATALIAACLGEGITTAGQIISILTGLGFGRKHLGAMLTKGAGLNSERHLWRKDGADGYRLHEHDDQGRNEPMSAAHITVPRRAADAAAVK